MKTDRKMKCLIIAVNQEKFPYPVMPIGAAYIATSLEEHGYEVLFLDLMFCKKVENEIITAIKKYNPQNVLISIRNTDNQVLIEPHNYMPKIKKLVQLVRQKTQAKIIIGGAAFTNYPKSIFRYLEPDYGIAGEGELSIIQLLQNDSRKKIPGLVYRQDNGEVIENKIDLTNTLNSSQYKALSYINIKKYLKKGSYVGIQTRRGCPRKCVYCSDNIITGRKVRLRDPIEVVQEIKKIKEKYQVNYFFFVDELFSSPLSYAKELLKTIIKENININFEIEDAPPLFDDEYVSLLKEAGCLGILFSPDSGSDSILKNIKKGFKKKHILDTCNLLHKHELPYFIVSLLGNPGEDIATVKESFEFFKTLPGFSGILVNYGLRIARGSELETMVKENGLIEKNDPLLFAKYYLSKNFNEEVLKYIYSECMKNPGWMTFSRIDQFIIKNLFEHMKMFTPKPEWKQAKMLTRILKPIRKLLSFFMKDVEFSDIQKNPDVVFY